MVSLIQCCSQVTSFKNELFLLRCIAFIRTKLYLPIYLTTKQISKESRIQSFSHLRDMSSFCFSIIISMAIVLMSVSLRYIDRRNLSALIGNLVPSCHQLFVTVSSILIIYLHGHFVCGILFQFIAYLSPIILKGLNITLIAILLNLVLSLSFRFTKVFSLSFILSNTLRLRGIIALIVLK